jgi:hypothetical protein
MLAVATLREILEKLLTPGLQRTAVSWTIEEKGHSQRHAYRLVGLHTKTCRYRSRRPRQGSPAQRLVGKSADRLAPGDRPFQRQQGNPVSIKFSRAPGPRRCNPQTSQWPVIACRDAPHALGRNLPWQQICLPSAAIILAPAEYMRTFGLLPT